MIEWRIELIHEIKIDWSQQAGFIYSQNFRLFIIFVDFSSWFGRLREEISVEKINITSVSV